MPIFLSLVHYFAGRIPRDRIQTNPEYKYYKRALLAKVYGGLGFILIYIFYYGGGDTTVYWKDAMTLNTLILTEPLCYLRIMFGDMRELWYFCFDLREHVPYHYLRDPQSFSVSRFSAPFALLSVDSILGTTILVAWFSFRGTWKMYEVFIEEYPDLKKELALAILFVPSVLFWGSGVMKDTYTYTAVCWMTAAVYGMLLKRRNVVRNLFYVVIASYVMLTLKPYIFVALLPGIMIWIVFNRIGTIQNPIIRLASAPIIVMVGIVVAMLVFSQASSSLGAYGSVDTIMDKAVATQEDLKREAYQGNSFDIGVIDPSLGGMLRISPAAIFAGLFRPTLVDVRNPLMLMSAIENTVLMFFMLYIMIRVGFFSFFRLVFGRPMILFSFVFAIFFSFSVGLTTSNFGSLVRYKIPALPFFTASLFMIRFNREEELSKKIFYGGGAVNRLN